MALSTWYCGVFEWCGVGLPCKFRLIDCFSNLLKSLLAQSLFHSLVAVQKSKSANRQKVLAVPLGGSHPLPAKRPKTTSASSSSLSTAMAHILSSTRGIHV